MDYQKNQRYAEESLREAEANRREKPTRDTTPLQGQDAVDIPDYGSSGQAMELAMMHLRESVPNGQRRRTECAFAALKRAVENHEAWLQRKGYNV